MIAQIAGQSGLPPSQIAATWSIPELREQVVLARLEGRGQEKLRTAQLRAEINNGFTYMVWAQGATEETPPPEYVRPVDFLPRKVKPKPTDQRIRNQLQKQKSFFDRLAGY